MDLANAGLLGLLTVLVVSLLGARELSASRARRLSLEQRAGHQRDEAPVRRMRDSLERRVRESSVGRRLVERLAAAGSPVRPLDFIGLALGAGIGGALLGQLLFPFWLSVFAGGLCIYGAFLWLERKRVKRREEFVAQLPELARLLSNGTSAGLSLSGALAIAVDEIEEPAREELRLVQEQMRIGRSLDTALERLEQRMPSRELGVLVGTLVVQQRMGGDVVRALQDMAETLDARKDLLREVRTLMSGSVFTAYLVALMGVGTIFLLNVISPGVLDRLLTSPIGILAFAVAAALYSTGFVLVRRVTRVDA